MTIFLEMLKLFLIFLKISLFTFGGGYAMIPLMNEELIDNGYFTLEQLNYLIGISEATPGPFSVNMASLSGFFVFAENPFWIQLSASVLATLGVILPSFIIILLFSIFSYKIIKTKPYKDAFKIIEPMVLSFIFVAFLSISLNVILGDFMNEVNFDPYALVIFIFVLGVGFIYKKISPITLVAISAILGILIYGLL